MEVLQDLLTDPKPLETYSLLGLLTNIVSSPGMLSFVPDKCEISIDRRYMPGETFENIISEFEGGVREDQGK